MRLALLAHAELDRIARQVSWQTEPYLRDDTAQEVRLAFWLYPPGTRKLAWLIARRVRNRLCRKERLQAEIAAMLTAGLPSALSHCDRRRAIARRYYARLHPKTVRALRCADPNGSKYWRRPEHYRAEARKRQTRMRARRRAERRASA